MALQAQALVEQLVEQHSAGLSRVHGFLRDAVPETYIRFSDLHADPEDLHGMVLCTSVRDAVLCLAGYKRKQEVALGTTLRLSEGPARSVVLKDASGTKIRVRRYPTDNFGDRLRVVAEPVEGASVRTAPRAGEQPTLDAELEEQVFEHPFATAVGADLFVLWWPDTKSASLEGAVLALVSDIDSGSIVRIHAVAALPSVSTPKRRPDPAGSQTPLSDFEEFGQAGAAGSGPEPA